MGQPAAAALLPSTVSPAAGPVIAALEGVDESGSVFVAIAGSGVIPARVSSHLDPAEVRQAAARRAGALVLVDAAHQRPVLIGLIEERLRPVPVPLPTRLAEPERGDPKIATDAMAIVDGRRVVMTGRDEIVLSCGKASITLKSDGKVVVKGTRVETDAEGVNRIKGASVRIN
jgi:hypothetical protein